MRYTPKVSSDGIAALTKLKDLKEFVLFGDDRRKIEPREDYPPDHIVGLFASCFELLPQLQVVLVRPKSSSYRYFNPLFFTSRALEKLSTPCTLQLQYLLLRIIPANIAEISFPQVRFLYLECDDDDDPVHESLLPEQFPKLEEIEFAWISLDNLPTILNGVFGRDLQRLKIKYEYDLLQNLFVLAVCPRLYELNVMMSSPHTVEGPHVNTSVRILRLASWGGLWVGLLEGWLRAAPNVEVLEVHLTHKALVGDENIDEWSRLSDLVRRGECLHHLQKLVISFDRGYKPDLGAYPHRWLKKYFVDNFTLTCTTHCQNLSQVIVGENLPKWNDNDLSFQPDD